MAEQNADQIADWNGQSGERWVAYQARLDAMLAAFGQAAIEAAAPATGERVLDVGCGAGGQVLGVDISEARNTCASRARVVAGFECRRAPALAAAAAGLGKPSGRAFADQGSHSGSSARGP